MVKKREAFISRHQKRVSRKYNIKNDSMVRYIVSALKSVSHEDFGWKLDEYERYAVRNMAKWARNAPLEEIMVIMSKLSIPFFLTGYDAKYPHKAFTMMKWRQDYARTKDVNGLLKQISEHKFFCLVGRDVLRSQALYSQLINSALYVPNSDFKQFLKHGMNAEGYSDVKNVDIVLGAICLQAGYQDLSVTDLAILYLCKRYDDLPLSGESIYQIMEYRREHDVIQRHLAKLTKFQYLTKHGMKKDSSYSLSEKGMLILNKARKAFFQDAQFWNQKNPNEAFKKSN